MSEFGVTKNMHVGIRVHLGTGNRDYELCRNLGIHLEHLIRSRITDSDLLDLISDTG